MAHAIKDPRLNCQRSTLWLANQIMWPCEWAYIVINRWLLLLLLGLLPGIVQRVGRGVCVASYGRRTKDQNSLCSWRTSWQQGLWVCKKLFCMQLCLCDMVVLQLFFFWALNFYCFRAIFNSQYSQRARVHVKVGVWQLELFQWLHPFQVQGSRTQCTVDQHVEWFAQFCAGWTFYHWPFVASDAF